MITVIQRVTKAKVSVNTRTISEIGEGMLVLVGIKKGDDKDKATRLAERCAHMRIFEDVSGKFNLSLKDVGGEALVVSQFTLLADTSRGRRPSFSDAEEPDKSEELYNFFVQKLTACGIRTKTGVFGERMLVSLDNNGPVTIIVEE
ncbi:D-tyrosyl-tRNA(Tyr) deacylase [candidate division WOR_3 bacterium SM23_42]|uniref:D-aminoacyl-tRNA deacylase n=1 Tax=candidate division WOR_3 bacterium SM23_42 TaxID=1703779 RepID=A0A0S8FW03_UNCW3|nr:MAG: D-tyrosyl-tRNA(Tyr) deacylase [candidate division WOR_3 bacterium SM23_42]